MIDYEYRVIEPIDLSVEYFFLLANDLFFSFFYLKTAHMMTMIMMMMMNTLNMGHELWIEIGESIEFILIQIHHEQLISWC